VASAAGPAIASVLVYLLMAVVLYIKPQGLFLHAGRAMRRAAPWVTLLLALAFPLAMQAEHQTYYLSFASRIFVYALAATSLNLILATAE